MATKWNRKRLEANLPVWAKAADVHPYDGKSVDDLVKWLGKVAERGDIDGLAEDGEVDTEAVRKAWARTQLKTVYITADGGEDVQVVDPPEQTEEADDEDMEGKAEGDPDEDEEVNKAYRALRKAVQKSGKNAGAPFMASVHEASRGGYGKAGAIDRMAERKRYDRKAARGETAYSCSDIAEIANAWYRVNWLKAFGDYSERKNDIDILQKAGSVYDNTLGGFLVPDGVSSEMIELKATYGIARQLAGFESMPLPKWDVNRFGDDVVVYKTAEGIAMTESDLTFSQVTLLSEELGALSLMSNRLINLSPISIGDAFGRSAARGFTKYEDDSYFNGANGFEGLETKVGTNSTKDVTGLTAWSGITLAHLLEWKSMLPAYTDQFPASEIPITCTRPVFEQVFRQHALAQGGATVEDLLRAGELMFDGHPIILNNSMDRTFANNAIAAYIGPFSKVTKMGELEGAARVDSSDQRHFEKNQMAFRALEEIAINCHDVNDTTESGVIALQVGA